MGGWSRAVRRGSDYARTPTPSPAETDDVSVVRQEIGVARLALHGQGVCSHETATTLHGLATGRQRPLTFTMEPTRPSHRDFTGIHLHRARLPPGHLTHVADLPVTSVARTVIDLARLRRANVALITADHALHRHAVTRRALGAVLQDCRRWPGVRRAAEVIDFADAAAESPLESVGRWCRHQYGLPPPELQHELDLPGGRLVRLDFWWEAAGVVGEADGLSKYDDPDVLRAEKLRQEELEAMGLVVVRFTWADVTQRPELTAARFRRALARATPLTLPPLPAATPPARWRVVLPGGNVDSGGARRCRAPSLALAWVECQTRTGTQAL